MKNIIVDFKKLTPEILALVVKKYPDGYGEGDVIKFKNAKNQTVEAVEVITQDTKYLIKISDKLEAVMDSYEVGDYEDFEADDVEAIKDSFEESDE
ncbi:hypothetical protein ACXGQW_05715 [Wenyingzhuangia sp. IMCC45533]